jgi:hypothetical protein
MRAVKGDEEGAENQRIRVVISQSCRLLLAACRLSYGRMLTYAIQHVIWEHGLEALNDRWIDC